MVDVGPCVLSLSPTPKFIKSCCQLEGIHFHINVKVRGGQINNLTTL